MKENILFEPYPLKTMTLRNRMVMAPLTRGRAEADGTPNDLMARYYRQRTEAGLIVSEATAISRGGVGWLGAPGIYTDAHVAGWRKVTEAVHEAGGRIFLQLWHMGRASHPDFLDGELPVAPSAVAADEWSRTPLGKKRYVVPRALELDEIPGIVNEYAAAAERARDAGFDGVEIHGANGYLIDQFLRDGSNRRTDAYGGSVANRARFLLEVTEAVCGAWSPDRVGVRLSPTGGYNDMRDGDPPATFGYAAEALNSFGLAYLHLMEALPGHPLAGTHERISPMLRTIYQGALIINGGFDAQLATAALARGEADLVAFGMLFLANPDLVRRFREGAPLNAPDYATLYTPGPQGYADYPALEA
ncbi:MAG: alkene reductase [Syntrophobacteraceae bacterium]|jgi:N-ethylmaleimide reductase|nr:alkene reductase [Syntrophobacteraceae bacterium]MCU0589719.1 alkene reductase [Syntrophobacteraceae bacterium]